MNARNLIKGILLGGSLYLVGCAAMVKQRNFAVREIEYFAPDSFGITMRTVSGEKRTYTYNHDIATNKPRNCLLTVGTTTYWDEGCNRTVDEVITPENGITRPTLAESGKLDSLLWSLEEEMDVPEFYKEWKAKNWK